ncbi:M14 family metallopeptidase [Macrococcoides canis]|uniref:M14 family metallopeptidase n=1 Tax=Macrococcoides canis TaxID=1855823 RepID=UPI00165DC098|nr:M14 family metallopeptidase [Macrococcus canis]QNR07829.1 hypothetical protein GL258_06000 [Macrococcus canis]
MELNNIKTKDKFHNYVTIKQADNTSEIELILCGSDGSVINSLTDDASISIMDIEENEVRQKSEIRINNGVTSFRIENDLKAKPHSLEITTRSGIKFPSNDNFTIYVTPTHNNALLNIITGIPRKLALDTLTQYVISYFNNIHDALKYKIDKGNVSVSDINKSLGLFDSSYFSEQFLSELNKGTITVSNVLNGSIITEKIADNAVTPEKTNLFEVTKNLWDGKYFDWYIYDYTNPDGTKEAYINKNYSGLQYTSIVPVLPGMTYTIQIVDKEKSNAFTIATSTDYPTFDSNGIYKTGLPVNKQGLYTVPNRIWTITIPQNHKYLYILAAQNQSPPTMIQVEKNGVATDYVPHLAIKKSLLPTSIFDQSNVGNFDKIDTLKIRNLMQHELYDVPSLGALNGSGAKRQIHELKTADMYALYDADMSKYPTYIKKELFATEKTGKPIYKYTYKPENPHNSNNASEKPLPKIFITSGVHGSEKASWYCTYEMMHQIADNWKSSPILEYLRWNFEIVLIPLVNVYGIDNISDPVTFNGKINSNGVDINRNYPVGWTASEPGTIGYSGTEPLTEIESKAIYDYLNNNDIAFAIDYHNFSSQTEPVFSWSVVQDEKLVRMSMDYYKALSNKWKRDDSTFPQSDSEFFGQVGNATAGGSYAPLVDFYGIPGGIFEICHTMWPKGNQAQYTDEVITLGTEAQLNYLYLACKSVDN